jgi:hypothetical protein
MSTVYALLPGEKQLYTFDWTPQMPSTSPLTTISSVAYTITPTYSPQTLNVYSTSIDTTNNKSTVGLQGAVSGETYQLTAEATLSNGEIVGENITFRGFNG